MCLWPMNENQTFLWIYGMFESMLEVYYFIFSTIHGTKHVMHLYDVAAYNSVVFRSIWWGYSKNCLWVIIMLMLVLSELQTAFGILVDLQNCPVHSSCRITSHDKYWIHQSANKYCNLFLQIIIGGGWLWSQRYVFPLKCLWFLGDSAICMILSGLVVKDAQSTGWVPSLTLAL